MFNTATAFDQDLGGWDVTSVTDAMDMFYDVQLSMANYDALLNGWDAQTLQSNVTFDGGNSNYCAGETARDNMQTVGQLDDHRWGQGLFCLKYERDVLFSIHLRRLGAGDCGEL